MATVRDRHKRNRLCFDMLIYRNSCRKVVYYVKRKRNRLVDIFYIRPQKDPQDAESIRSKAWTRTLGGYMITNYNHVKIYLSQ